jgi:hypothetical protein
MRYLTFHRYAPLNKVAACLCLAAAAFVFTVAGVTPARATEIDLVINQVTGLNFGKIRPGITGTVTLTPGAGGSCSRSASPSYLVVASSSYSCGSYTVVDPSENKPLKTYTYTPSTTSSTLTNTGGGGMTLGSFTFIPTPDIIGNVSYTERPGSCINPKVGFGLSCPLYIGATLTVNSAPSASGTITGENSVIVVYVSSH